MKEEWYTRKIDGTFKPGDDIDKPERYALYALIFGVICLFVACLV